LVTHDRYMMDRVSTSVLGLDGFGNAEQFADYSQWESWQQAQEAKVTETTPVKTAAAVPRSAITKRKLSYMEAREYAAIEERVSKAESTLEAKRAALNDPAIASDAPRLLAISAEIEEAEKLVDLLYSRWAELEEKQS
jgi:ABC transport system ATP-binding/permease protein